MSRERFRSARANANALRFAAVLAVLAGYVFVLRTGEARIAARVEQNEQLATALRTNASTIARAPALGAERDRLARRLHALAPEPNLTAAVARFLGDAARTAQRRHATFATIAATGVTHGAPAPASVALDVTVEGRYADVLSTVRDLSATAVPATVDVTALARKNVDAPDPTLSALLRVTIAPPSVDGDA